ncbi:MAG: hypothetical protein NT007_18315 [Candidatus Kapabacteria bacterium]|nr:hypothetical protein [Candidatus Kapabacteria bacterium]
MKTSLTQKLLLLALALGLGFMIACTGPDGPPGKDGVNGTNGTNGKDGTNGTNGTNGKDGTSGTNGKDGSQDCEKCHNTANSDFYKKWYQYDLSLHGRGIVFEEEAGRTQCGGCHSGNGFAEACGLNQNDAVTEATSPINCRACHFIHTNYDSTDFKLRWTKAVTLRQPATPVQTFDFQGVGNTCAKCHQARTISRTQTADGKVDTLAKASGTTTYSRVGPHYGIISNMMTGIGIPPMAGVNYGTPNDNRHSFLPKGCVSCHMAQDTTNPAMGGHVFTMPQANYQNFTTAYFNATCNLCHPKATLKAAANTTLIKNDIAAIRTKLINANLLDTTQALAVENGVTTYKVIGEYVKITPKKLCLLGSDTVTALINYLYVAKDRSNGAHNPALTKEIVNGLKNFFK